MAQLGYWAPESRAGGADLSVVGGEFIPNIETTETKYFGRDELPENLAGEKTSREQILMCFDANESNHWETKFD